MPLIAFLFVNWTLENQGATHGGTRYCCTVYKANNDAKKPRSKAQYDANPDAKKARSLMPRLGQRLSIRLTLMPSKH